MDPSFGARLRAQREEKHIALSKISEDTKIKVSMLEGLERDDVAQWPEGIFRRAYVRSYARAIGLDPETLVREFLEAHPDPVPIQPEATTELEEPQWPAGFRRLVTSAMAVVPSRRPEPVQAELNLSRGGEEDDRRLLKDERHSPISLLAAAELCVRLGRVVHRREVAPILKDAAVALDAVGLIVWTWDSRSAALRPSVAHGYTDAVLSRMPKVRPDSDNAIATAFRLRRRCIVDGGQETTGAVAVPLMAHGDCPGVLAIELERGDEQREDVLAFATILAAQLVTLAGAAPLAEAVNA